MNSRLPRSQNILFFLLGLALSSGLYGEQLDSDDEAKAVAQRYQQAFDQIDAIKEKMGEGTYEAILNPERNVGAAIPKFQNLKEKFKVKI